MQDYCDLLSRYNEHYECEISNMAFHISLKQVFQVVTLTAYLQCTGLQQDSNYKNVSPELFHAHIQVL
jgi:hypothetical protein